MISIVNVVTHCDDKRKITGLDIKLKSFNDDCLTGQALVTTVSVAMGKTTLVTDDGRNLRISLNPKRNTIVNVTIAFSKENTLTFHDVANFLEHFQKSVDETKLF